MADITRKGFLGAVAAAIAAPAVAGAKVARRRDVITQAELQAIIDADIALDRRCWSLRRRLDSGAVVQPGALDIDVEEGEFEEAGYANAKGAAFCGLSIDPAAHVAESKARRAEYARRRAEVRS
jgi:hypothetical protein